MWGINGLFCRIYLLARVMGTVEGSVRFLQLLSC